LASDASAVLAVPRQNVESADFKASGRLVRVLPLGQRLNTSMTIKAHWFPGVLRVFVQLGGSQPGSNQPGSSQADSSQSGLRENILLEMRPSGQNSIRVMRAGDKAPHEIPPAEWKATSIGPGFDIEDFIEPQFFWQSQTVEENVKYGARDCDLVTSKPGMADRTDYSQIRTWLDKAISFPVYAEKTVKGSGEVKEFTYFGLRHDQGVWSASQIEVKLHGHAGSTLLIVERGSAKAHLTAADFAPAQLEKF
jgi:hypothetical protein